MSKKGPGRSQRKSITLLEAAKKFGPEDQAKAWIENERWRDGPECPYRRSDDVQSNVKHPTVMYRRRECESKQFFGLKTGAVMEGSKPKYGIWAIGIYLFSTNIKGISSMRLHRELGIGQKAAWFMLHRLRTAYDNETGPFAGPVEADETYIGGREANKHWKRKLNAGRGTVGKSVVAGTRDRKTEQVIAKVIPNIKAKTLQGFVEEATEPDAQGCTDEGGGYVGMDRKHESVNQSAGVCVREMAHTQGIEPLWAMLKRAHKATYDKFSKKHLDRYIDEFPGRHNVRDSDTIDQMRSIIRGIEGKRLKCDQLIADNGLASGARGCAQRP